MSVFAPINKRLRSLKLTAGLMTALVILFLAGLLIPQKSLLGGEAYLRWKQASPTLVAWLETLQLTAIYTAPLTLLLWALFFLNLAAVMIWRTPVIWQRCQRPALPQQAGFINGYRHSHIFQGNDLKPLQTRMQDAGYRVISNGSSLAAVKNRFAPLGTLLFHLSFFLLLLGGVSTFYTRFRAEASVAVGESFNGAYTRVFTRPQLGEVPAASFSVSKVSPEYYDQRIPVGLKVVLETPVGERIASINHPYLDGTLSFLVKDIDISALFIVRNQDGREVDGAYAKLKVLQGEKDSFDLGGYHFKARFYTDYLRENPISPFGPVGPAQVTKNFLDSERQTQNPEVLNPAFSLEVYKDGVPIHSGAIRPGETLRFDQHSLTFAEHDYWVLFYVGHERGLYLVYAAFALMVAALVLRFGFYRQELRAFAEAGKIYLAGRAEYYPSQFAEEVQNIADAAGLNVSGKRGGGG